MNRFFCDDIENSLGKVLFNGPGSHHLSCQNRIEFPLPTFKLIPSSMIVLIFEVAASFFILWDHVPFSAFLKISDEAFSPLISYTDIRILFHRALSDSEYRHHHLNNKIRFLYMILPTPRLPRSFGSSIEDHLTIG